jgi:hypothetical protein
MEIRMSLTKKLKYSICATLLCSPVYSGEWVKARVLQVNPQYSNSTQIVEREVCNVTREPVRRTVTNNGGDVLTGMILGGIFGGTITESDKGARNGAIIGGLLAGNNNQTTVMSHRNVRRCWIEHHRQPANFISGYNISVRLHNGKVVDLYTEQHPGKFVEVYIDTIYRTN